MVFLTTLWQCKGANESIHCVLFYSGTTNHSRLSCQMYVLQYTWLKNIMSVLSYHTLMSKQDVLKLCRMDAICRRQWTLVPLFIFGPLKLCQASQSLISVLMCVCVYKWDHVLIIMVSSSVRRRLTTLIA